jgi:hypothetical protein
MGTQIRQRRGALRIEAEIRQRSVWYRERDVFRSHETTVPLLEVADEPTRRFDVSRLYLLITTFFVFLFLFRLYRFVTSDEVSLGAVAIAAGWLGLAGFGTWMRSAHYVGLRSSAGDLMFFKSARGDDPTAFLHEIQVAKQKLLSEGRSVADMSSGFEADTESEMLH